MIRFALVEDNPADCELLQTHMERFRQETGLVMKYDIFTDGAMLVESPGKTYDIIIMDIEMPLLDGMGAAMEIRKRDDEVIILFMTNAAQYAMKGYEVGALDYLLKPIGYFAFSQCLQKAIRRLENTADQFIAVRVNRGVQKINLAEITHIESQKHMLIYHTLNGDFVAIGTIKRTETELADKHFSKGNSGCLINLRHVDAIKNGLAIVGGHSIPLSRSRKASFEEAFLLYIDEVAKW